jgi:predicted site-specific integrase-resolvase
MPTDPDKRVIYVRKRAAKILETSVKTLHRWEQQGALIAHRDAKNRAFYTADQLKNFLGLPDISLPGEADRG